MVEYGFWRRNQKPRKYNMIEICIAVVWGLVILAICVPIFYQVLFRGN